MMYILSVLVTITCVIGVPLLFVGIVGYGKLEGQLEAKSYALRFGWIFDRYLPEYYW